MTKRIISLAIAVVLSLPLAATGSRALAATQAPVSDWAGLQKQAATGVSNIVLDSNIVCDTDEGLAASGTVTIEGKGYAIEGAIVDSGRVIFKDVQLLGTNGAGDECGGAALTLRGEGTIAMLSGTARATGGRSGVSGERGGDGVLMTGDGQGLILRNKALAIGGTGRLYGGDGVRVDGCESSVMVVGDAACMGNNGLGIGGAGLSAPACAKVSLGENGAAVGGASAYVGGNGVHSTVCENCDVRQSVTVSGAAMLTSGIGEDGGHAVFMERIAPEKEPDLLLEDECVLIGGAGNTAGSALSAAHATLFFDGSPSLYGGDYYLTKAPVMRLTDCEETGNWALVLQTDGMKVDNYPANNMSMIINNELSQLSRPQAREPIENGLATRELVVKLGGVSVGKNRVSQAKVNNADLRITLWNASYEKRFDFIQRLSSDGGEGVRLVLVTTASDAWLTLDSTVAALSKLLELGVTQLAFTSAEPVYYERIVDIAALLEAIKANEDAVKRVLLGTADDCVIFVDESSKRVYQEELMAEIARPLEPEETAETGETVAP